MTVVCKRGGLGYPEIIGGQMTRDADVEAILTYRQPVDDLAVENARAQINPEQMARWAEEVSCYTIGGLGPSPVYKRGNMLTLEGKVPYLSAAGRIAILQAAIDYTKALG